MVQLRSFMNYRNSVICYCSEDLNLDQVNKNFCELGQKTEIKGIFLLLSIIVRLLLKVFVTYIIGMKI